MQETLDTLLKWWTRAQQWLDGFVVWAQARVGLTTVLFAVMAAGGVLVLMIGLFSTRRVNLNGEAARLAGVDLDRLGHCLPAERSCAFLAWRRYPAGVAAAGDRTGTTRRIRALPVAQIQPLAADAPFYAPPLPVRCHGFLHVRIQHFWRSQLVGSRIQSPPSNYVDRFQARPG